MLNPGTSKRSLTARRIMRVVGALLAIGLALILLTAGTVLRFMTERRRSSDRICAETVHKIVVEIETFRQRDGQLPEQSQLRYGNRLHYLRPVTSPSGSTTAPPDYEFQLRRSQNSLVSYSSVTGDTCDSQAIWLVPVLVLLLFAPSVALIWWSVRAIRRALRQTAASDHRVPD